MAGVSSKESRRTRTRVSHKLQIRQQAPLTCTRYSRFHLASVSGRQAVVMNDVGRKEVVVCFWCGPTIHELS